MIISTLKIYPGSGHRKDILDILRSMEWSLRGTPGCLEFSYSNCRKDDSEYFVQVALWRSEADLTRYIRSGSFDRMLAAMELSEAPPEVRIHEIQRTRGMEYIESLRAVSGG